MPLSIHAIEAPCRIPYPTEATKEKGKKHLLAFKGVPGKDRHKNVQII